MKEQVYNITRKICHTVSRTEKNIVKEILRECGPRKLHPNENFVMFYVKLLLLNPNWGITENLLTSRSNVQALVKYVISHLESTKSVEMRTLKMQFYYMWSIEHIEDTFTSTRELLMARINPIKEQICLTTQLKTEEDIISLRRLMVIYIVFLSGLGSPLKKPIYEEALYALNSILNDTELKEFCTCSNKEKNVQLENLSMLVCGIRLFNKYCDKGGAGIPELPNLFHTAAELIKNDIESTLEEIMQKVTLLTKVYNKYYMTDKDAFGNFYLKPIFPSHVDLKYLEICKDELIHFRQYELYIRLVLESVNEIINKVSRAEEEMQTTLEVISKLVVNKLSVPAAVVFPLLETLSNCWSTFQRQVILLSKYNLITSNLEAYSKYTNFKKSIFEELFNAERFVEERRVSEVTCAYEFFSDLCGTMDIMSVLGGIYTLEYTGFCGWKLVESNGVLIPGNHCLRIYKFNNKYFTFSTMEAFMGFTNKPEDYTMRVLSIARKKPQLIYFLNIEDDLIKVSTKSILFKEKYHFKQTENKRIQTDSSYIIPPCKDSTYKWNIWDLRRDVLRSCHFTTLKTTSTQTLKSHSRNEIKTQTVIMKESKVQNMSDKYTNTPTPSNFIFGLRDRKANKQFVFDLTRPPRD